MQVKLAAKYLGGLALAAVLLWWVLRGTAAEELWAQVKRATWLSLALCILLNIGHNVFRVWRWQVLLSPIRRQIPFRPMFVAIMLGYMTSWIIPGRLGELVRPIVLSGQEDLPLGPTIGTVVIDRLLDASAVVLLFVVGTWITPLESAELARHAEQIRASSLVVGVMVLLAVGSMLFLSAKRGAISHRLERLPGLLRWIGRSILALSSGVSALRSPKLLLAASVYSLLAWLTISIGTWFGVRAVGAEISFGAMLIIMPLIVIGVAVPTPGGAGSYHAMMKLGLVFFGLSEVIANTAAIMVHLSITVPVILLGVILLWSEGISWKRMIGGARQIRDLGEAAEPAMENRS